MIGLEQVNAAIDRVNSLVIAMNEQDEPDSSAVMKALESVGVEDVAGFAIVQAAFTNADLLACLQRHDFEQISTVLVAFVTGVFAAREESAEREAA